MTLRNTRNRGGIGIALAALAATALLGPAAAVADPVLVLGLQYSDLDGDWNPGTGVFTAQASDDIGDFGGSEGWIKRYYAPTGVADFDRGFFGDSSADFLISMNLENITSDWADVGAGSSLTATDADGDTMTATVTGHWWLNGASVVFDGQITNIVFTDLGDQDDKFNGAGTGGDNDSWFSMDFGSLSLPFSGAIDGMSFPEGVDFFDDGGFVDAVTQGGGQIIPAPAAVLLGVIGLATVGWVTRRRFVG